MKLSRNNRYLEQSHREHDSKLRQASPREQPGGTLSLFNMKQDPENQQRSDSF